MTLNHDTSQSHPDPVPDPTFFQRLLLLLHIFIATGLFSGYFPLFPGTIGSLIGMLILWFTPFNSHYWILAAVLIAGTWAADVMSKRWGKDPSRVVIDEVAGIFITLIPFPKDPVLYFTGFFLFRIFDIVKPFPCRRLEKIPGGPGIMLDDVAAALYACILLYAVFIFIN